MDNYYSERNKLIAKIEYLYNSKNSIKETIGFTINNVENELKKLNYDSISLEKSLNNKINNISYEYEIKINEEIKLLKNKLEQLEYEHRRYF